MSGRKSRGFSQMQHCASPAQSMRQDGLRAKCRFLRFARKIFGYMQWPVFGRFDIWKAIVMNTKKTGLDLRLIANHPVF